MARGRTAAERRAAPARVAPASSGCSGWVRWPQLRAKKRCAGASADSQERTVSWHGRVHGLKMGEQDPVRVAGSSVCWPVRAVRELEQEEHNPRPAAGVTSSREPWHRPPPLPRGTAHAAGATVQLVGFLAIPRGRPRAQATSGSAPSRPRSAAAPHNTLSRAAGVQRPIESLDLSAGESCSCTGVPACTMQQESEPQQYCDGSGGLTGIDPGGYSRDPTCRVSIQKVAEARPGAYSSLRWPGFRHVYRSGSY